MTLGQMIVSTAVLLCGSASAATLYDQNFDAAGQSAAGNAPVNSAPGTCPAATCSVFGATPAGWTVVANGSDKSASLTVGGDNLAWKSGASEWGGVSTGYYATKSGSDYSLGYYASAIGQTNYLRFIFTATAPTTDIAGSFDVEVPWSRFDGATSRTQGFNNGFRYAKNHTAFDARGYAWGTQLISGGNLLFSNSQLDASEDERWLDDAEMTANLLRKNYTFQLTGVELLPGDTLTFIWAGDYSSGSAKNLLVSVDNFQLTGTQTPEPGTLGVFGAGLATIGLIARRRRSA